MADLNGAYDPDAQPATDRDPFPEGDYNLELTETDVVPTKAGTGQLFKYTAQVVDGEFKGRLLWGQMNLQNANAQAQEIGQREFAALRHATGVLSPADTQDLHFRQFSAKVGIEPAKGEYKAKNIIKRFYYEDDAAAATPAGKAAATAANDNKPGAAPANDNKPAVTAAKRPWASKK